MPKVPRFCIDEGVFLHLAADAPTAISSLDPLLRAGESVVSHKGGPPELVQTIHSIQSQVSGREFAEFLYQEVWAHDRDFVRRLEVLIDRCSKYDPPAAAPPKAKYVARGLSVAVNSHCARRVLDERLAGGHYYIVVQGEMPRLIGNGSVAIQDRKANSYFLYSEEDLVNAYRQFLVDATTSEDEFFSVCDEAFPGLIFHSEITFKRFSKSYAAMIAGVVDHLVFLNDEFVCIGKAEAWDIHKMTKKARINFSEETGKARNTERLVKHRRVYFGKQKIECTLHTKITRQSDRIHFHAPHKEIDPQKVLVGIFTDHLPTS